MRAPDPPPASRREACQKLAAAAAVARKTRKSPVVWAISEGRKAAQAADAYLAGLGEEPGEDPVGALLSA
jgi:hypothetical protein